MLFDETTLSSTHEITRLSIQSNTQIAPKATTIISKFSKQQQLPKEKEENSTTTATAKLPPLIILRAQSRWASKLISIVEIAKRNLAESTNTNTTNSGIKIFQYSALSSEIIEVERKPKKTKGLGAAAPEGEGEGSEDDDGAFQTMGSTAAPGSGEADEGGVKKKRAVPVLTVYLASAPVKALKSEFGEQVASGGTRA